MADAITPSGCNTDNLLPKVMGLTLFA